MLGNSNVDGNHGHDDVQGCNVAPSRLAELQVDAMLNDNGGYPGSPNTSGRSSSSECS